jgi:hypothetical protein
MESTEAPKGGEDPAGNAPAALVAAIREASGQARLSRLSVLAAAFPAEDVEALAEASGAADLRKMRGAGDEVYFFSVDSMTEAYALHLFRIEEHDPLALVRDTVRDESRIYPRPTATSIFLEPPFSLSPRDLEEVIGRMSLHPDCGDIRSCQASNGARYLYSTRHLAPVLAESLAEWIEVGQRDNP